MSVRLMGLIDTINILDKFDIDYRYDKDKDEYIISDNDYQKILHSSKNKKYIERLKTGNGRMYGRNGLIAGSTVYGSDNDKDSQIMFTQAAVLDLLTQIDELSDKQITLTETLDGNIQVSIGSSDYIIESDIPEIEVDDEVIDEIDQENESAYQAIVDSGQVDLEYDEIEGGMIKDTVKALMLGGLIRFAGKHLLK